MFAYLKNSYTFVVSSVQCLVSIAVLKKHGSKIKSILIRSRKLIGIKHKQDSLELPTQFYWVFFNLYIMNNFKATVILKNHLLFLSGEIVNKQKTKDVIDALQVFIDKQECEHEFTSVPRNTRNDDYVAQCRKCNFRP